MIDLNVTLHRRMGDRLEEAPLASAEVSFILDLKGDGQVWVRGIMPSRRVKHMATHYVIWVEGGPWWAYPLGGVPGPGVLEPFVIEISLPPQLPTMVENALMAPT